jgi:hypothetical protein
VLQPALQAYQRLLIVLVLNPDASLEKEEKVESKVDAAEVIIIKLITNKITTPNAFPTQMLRLLSFPAFCIYTNDAKSTHT